MYLDDFCLFDDTAALAEDMNALICNPELSDVTFVVQGERIRAHRLLLVARCEFFRQGNASLLLSDAFLKRHFRCAELGSTTH